ncbi:Inositol 1,4,5-trisphosphate receptor type 2 [Acipenser ruthenus]|uniref:Inositol 1,4,5-trisphosphate receptor type 2 n=1 Tax=Acipenser ruthenus TaxID=7906 RepID=A0A444U9I9_ACIRT|nr:Inositol 1,4,5-trisphosphate receptor type 2 [Acipenser ruthenus]
MSPAIAIMEPILRYLQLLCENHNRDLQNFLRHQNNKTNYNLVCETLQFLDCICGSTTGGLGLLGLYINERNVDLVKQTLESITEYCQGPCHENQVTLYSKGERLWQLKLCKMTEEGGKQRLSLEAGEVGTAMAALEAEEVGTAMAALEATEVGTARTVPEAEDGEAATAVPRLKRWGKQRLPWRLKRWGQ